MPVPKKRLGHSDQMTRRANWKAILPSIAMCSNCGGVRRSHTMCPSCGFYKGRVVTTRYIKTAKAEDHSGHDHD